MNIKMKTIIPFLLLIVVSMSSALKMRIKSKNRHIQPHVQTSVEESHHQPHPRKPKTHHKSLFKNLKHVFKKFGRGETERVLKKMLSASPKVVRPQPNKPKKSIADKICKFIEKC